MGYELKANTAVRIPVGPLVDPTDGKTAEVALDVTGLSVQLYQIKTDGTAVVRTQITPGDTSPPSDNDMILVPSSTDGMYDLELTAAQLNWLGNGRISFYDVDGFLVHWIDISVVSANYFDWKYGTGNVNGDVIAISGDTAAADNLEAACDGNTYNVGGGAVVAASVTGAVGSVTGAVGSVAAGVTLANGAHGGAATAITLQTPIEANVASETDHDFTATQLTSLNAATPAVTVSDKTGFKLASDGLDLVAAPADLANDTAARATFVGMFRALFNRFYNAVTQTATQQKVANDSGTVVSTMTVSDDGVTQTKAKSA